MRYADYRVEYCAMIYILELYDEEEHWEGILIDAEFNYILAFEYLIDVLEDIVRGCRRINDQEGLDFYSTILERANDIYDNGVI